MTIKLTFLFTLLWCFGIIVNAQPGTGKIITIQNLLYGSDTLYLKNVPSYGYSHVGKKKGQASYIIENTYSPDGTGFNYFIYHKDTMAIKIIYTHYDAIDYKIKKMSFIKGQLVINLFECIKNKAQNTYPITI